MQTSPTSPYESYRRAELRLRMLLFGDESDVPGVVRGGEDVRLRVRADLRRMRQAVDELEAAREEAAVAKPVGDDLAEDLRRAASARAEGRDSDLLTPAEAAGALGISVSSIYRAVRVGELRAIRPAPPKRGGMRIPTSEIRRLAGEVPSRSA
jgi:excisionase family DNA binding protein